MDILSNPLPPPSRLNQWPNVPAEKGKFYGVQDPVFRKDQLVVMLAETWATVGTIIEHQKRTMKAQDDTVKKLQAANGALAAQLNDMQERYDNLRTAYRADKRAQLMQENPELAAADQPRESGKSQLSFL
jgi:hypothetical protein